MVLEHLGRSLQHASSRSSDADSTELRGQGSGGRSLDGSRSVSWSSVSAQKPRAPVCHAPSQELEGIREDMGVNETAGKRQQDSEPAGLLLEVLSWVYRLACEHNDLP